MKNMPDTLSEAGALFLASARDALGCPLSLDEIDVTRESGWCDDLAFPTVRLRSRIPFGTRALRYGVTCVNRRDELTGRVGPQGHPIPTDAYVARVVGAYGEDCDRARSVSLDPYAGAVRRGRMPLIEALNRAGEDLKTLLSADYEVQEDGHGR